MQEVIEKLAEYGGHVWLQIRIGRHRDVVVRVCGQHHYETIHQDLRQFTLNQSDFGSVAICESIERVAAREGATAQNTTTSQGSGDSTLDQKTE